MCLLAIQPYYKILREVTSIEQKDIEDERNIYLYEEKLVTEYREFPIDEVRDISYKEAGEIGILYVHTNSGLYSYTVKTSTQKFIEVFKNHKEKRE